MWIPTKFMHKDVFVHLKMMSKKPDGSTGPAEIPGKITEATSENTFTLQVVEPDGSGGIDVLLLRENIHDITAPATIIVAGAPKVSLK